MTKEKTKYLVVGIISLILTPVMLMPVFFSLSEGPDILMPSFYIADGTLTWYVLLASIVLEAVFVKLFTKDSFAKALVISSGMNMIIAVLSVIGLHIVGLIVELMLFFLPVGTFHIIHWVVNFLVIALANACIEGLFVKLVFKYKFKKLFGWLYLANLSSLVLCFLFNLSWIDHMYFIF